MSYHQLTSGERYALSALRKQGFSQAAIARALGRHRSTISREVRRNQKQRWYRAEDAEARSRTRRRNSRRNHRIRAEDWALICSKLKELWSPEQIAGSLRNAGLVRVSHETIDRHTWEDRRRGGTLWLCLRGSRKQRRKRNGSYDSRGRLAGERMIAERPRGAQNRSGVGHLEGDR